jgi:hypothetical protein
MPFKSKAQFRKFQILESQGSIPEGTVEKWVSETKSFKSLPDRVKKASFYNKMNRKISSQGLTSNTKIKQIDIQKEKLDSINNEKRKGMSPVEYRNSKVRRY